MSTKKMKNLKAENYIIWWIFQRPQAWEADSEIALRDYTGEVGEEPGYIGIFATKNKENIKR